MKGDAMSRLPEDEGLPPLENGERLDQKAFHERYEAMPEDTRAELIGGIVYIHHRTTLEHGRFRGRVTCLIGEYQDATPVAEAYPGVTVILGPESEPQPDATILI